MTSTQTSCSHAPGTLLDNRIYVHRHRAVDGPAVLYVHGATFPSAQSVCQPFNGRSWADELTAAGLDVWALDFVGYGRSVRYRAQRSDPAASRPLGRAPIAADQVTRVLAHIGRERGGGRVSLLAHSWGTLVAGLVATTSPDLVDRLVLFGPITRRQTDPPRPTGLGGWRPITVQAQYERFVEDVPAGHPPVLAPAHFQDWARGWLASDPASSDWIPPVVRTPSGPTADILAAWSGQLPYDPAQVRAPTCIIRGEWDSLCTDKDARGLWDSLSAAPLRRDVKISGGTHLMHLESSRHALHRESATFLRGETR